MGVFCGVIEYNSMFYRRRYAAYARTNAACRTHFLQFFADKKYIYFSIYSIKHENVLLGVLSYGYPMGMLWLSYGINSQ